METTEAVETTTELVETTQGAAAKITVTMGVKVPRNAQDYVEDSRVTGAYKELMEHVTGLDPDMIEVELKHEKASMDGNLTVTYVLTIPYEDQGDGLMPVVPVKSVEDKLAQLDLKTLNEMLDKEIDEATASGEYAQEIEGVQEDQTSLISGGPSSRYFATPLILVCLLTGQLKLAYGRGFQ